MFYHFACSLTRWRRFDFAKTVHFSQTPAWVYSGLYIVFNGLILLSNMKSHSWIWTLLNVNKLVHWLKLNSFCSFQSYHTCTFILVMLPFILLQYHVQQVVPSCLPLSSLRHELVHHPVKLWAIAKVGLVHSSMGVAPIRVKSLRGTSLLPVPRHVAIRVVVVDVAAVVLLLMLWIYTLDKKWQLASHINLRSFGYSSWSAKILKRHITLESHGHMYICM